MGRRPALGRGLHAATHGVVGEGRQAATSAPRANAAVAGDPSGKRGGSSGGQVEDLRLRLVDPP